MTLLLLCHYSFVFFLFMIRVVTFASVSELDVTSTHICHPCVTHSPYLVDTPCRSCSHLLSLLVSHVVSYFAIVIAPYTTHSCIESSYMLLCCCYMLERSFCYFFCCTFKNSSHHSNMFFIL